MINERTIRQWWDVFRQESPLTEIRVLGRKKTYSGYFTDPEAAIGQLKRFDRQGGIYATLNDVKDSCYGRSQHDAIIESPKSTTNDNDIDIRRWVLVDFDPERPSDTNASDEEKKVAEERMRRVYRYLRENGFNAPVVADSGNGYHLYYRVNLANDQEATDLVKGFLQSLDALFSDEAVKVDTSVFNASRIVKIIGTSSNKGSSTKERPQRESSFIYVPDIVSPTDPAYFRKVADFYPKEEKPGKQNNYSTEKFDVDQFITEHGINVIRRSRFNGGEKYILDHCPFDVNHKDAAILRLDSGAVAFKCFHNSCSHYGWKEFRLHFDPSAYSRTDYAAFRAKRTYYGKAAPVATQYVEEDARGKKWLSMSDVKYVDPSNFVSIPTGLLKLDQAMGGFTLGDVTILSGRSGAGKSTLLDHFALTAVQRGYKVAAWSGELQDFRFQSWMDQMAVGKEYVRLYPGIRPYYYAPRKYADKVHAWLEGKMWLYNNNYGSNWEQLREDVLSIIHDNGVQLILLDNLMAVDFDGAASDNDVQTKFIKEIKNIAKRENVHFVLVCHPRKEMSFQLLRKESIAGTANLTNLCDNLLISHRIGRDFERRAKEFLGDEIVNTFIADGYDLVVEVAKNRSHGAEDDFSGFFFEEETRRIKCDKSENVVYGWNETEQPAPVEVVNYDFDKQAEGDIPDDIWYSKD